MKKHTNTWGREQEWWIATMQVNVYMLYHIMVNLNALLEPEKDMLQMLEILTWYLKKCSNKGKVAEAFNKFTICKARDATNALSW